MSSIEIIPAIMPQTLAEMKEKVGFARGLVKTIHLDVMDGKVTPSVNWPFVGEGLKEMQKMSTGEVNLPFWKEIDYEVDIMMMNAEESFAEWVNTGFKRIIIHSEYTKKLSSVLKEWKGVVEIGVAVGIETDNSVIYPFVEQGIDFVQFMGIYQIGFQGNPFDRRVLPKISKMREVYPDLPISVDGSVNKDTLPSLVRAGANRLVMGSAIFSYQAGGKTSQDIEYETIDSLTRDVLHVSETLTTTEEDVSEAILMFRKMAEENIHPSL